MKKKCIHVTGFGPFGSFKENPSSIVGEEAVKELQKAKYPITFESLETSIDAVEAFYKKAKNPNVLMVHIGVNDFGKTIEIESQAKNIANFSIPDVNGVKCKNKPILDNYKLRHTLVSSLPVNDISKKFDFLNSSNDAGEYICNYIYFLALANSGMKNRGAVFIHIPPLSTIPKDVQVKQLCQILSEIAKY